MEKYSPLDTEWEKLYPKVRTYNLSPSLLKAAEAGCNLLSDERKFRISNLRWLNSYNRQDPLDTGLDCCSSLEAALGLPNELRLRISLSVYHIVGEKKGKAFATAYNMYGARNKFIHGEKTPDASPTS